MKKEYILQKIRGYKLVIKQIEVEDNTLLPYNGNEIPLVSNKKDKEYLHNLLTVKNGISSKTLKEGYPITITKKDNLSLYEELLRYISRKLYLASKVIPERYNVNRLVKAACKEQGTYVLIRKETGDEIFIANRSKSKTKEYPLGYSTKNHVCIPDNIKVQFFSDADKYNLPINKKHFLTIKDGEIFNYYSNYMNEEYLRQLN